MGKRITGEATLVQRMVITQLRDYIAAYGIAPTVRELAVLVGRARTAVEQCLDRLERDDYITTIERDGRRLSRGILINDRGKALASTAPTPRKKPPETMPK